MKIEYRIHSPSVVTTQNEIMRKVKDGCTSQKFGGGEKITILKDDEHAFEISAEHRKNVEELFEQLAKDLKSLSS